MMPTRRQFIKTTALSAAALAAGLPACQTTPKNNGQAPIPGYLKDYFARQYVYNPRAAALSWFEEARFGLFIHYGLYSQLGRGEWVMFREQIPVAKYKKLKATFKPDKFDADFITDLALDAGMKYINITARHHDGFCLFETKTSNYNSVNSPAKRDLIGELAEQCQKKDLGFFTYYSLGADWQHPYFYPRKYNPIVQPAYKTPDPTYQWQSDEDFLKYLDYATRQIKELLTNYGPLAGMWFDPLMGYYGRPDLFPIKDIYAMVRKLQPQCLISFKQGVTGTEDFAAPERGGHSLTDRIIKRYGKEAGVIADKAWQANKNKRNEICDTLQRGGWGFNTKTKHKTADQVMTMLANAEKQNCNLLLNTGPLPDGSIHELDVKVLREVGTRLKIK